MLKITADENISFAEEAFSQFGKAALMPGREIKNKHLFDTDILLVRSITKVDENLLKGTPVKFVGTATIGTDHIDKNYLNLKGIAFKDAQGCNSDAVTEYIFTALLKIVNEDQLKLRDLSLGVVGAGNIGVGIARLGKKIGMKVLLNDPPLQRKTGSKIFLPLIKVLEADIITFHVPLIKSGKDKTYHLLDSKKLNRLKEGKIILNSSRGSVIDNDSLSELIGKKSFKIIFDVWENEPVINIELLKSVKIASPHIAGYSLEGKINGTKMIYNSLCKFLGENPLWKPEIPLVENPEVKINGKGNLENILYTAFNSVYDIERDDAQMRNMIEMPASERPIYFDRLRKNYPLRREFSNYKIDIDSNDEKIKNILQKFRFLIH